MVTLFVSYNTSLNHHAVSSYTLAIANTPSEAPRALKQDGPVANNVLHASGVFATQREAVQAALGWINIPAAIWAVDDCLAGQSVLLQPPHADPPKSWHSHSRLLGRRTRAGEWIAA